MSYATGRKCRLEFIGQVAGCCALMKLAAHPEGACRCISLRSSNQADSDLLWDSTASAWVPRKLNGSTWHQVRDEDTQRWIRNKYRVLLTRARLGTVIWVPEGSDEDHTRNRRMLDAIASTLQEAGAIYLDLV